ncbi:MAG: hypothetical protein R3Y04_08450 [Rikenellaceae bacterium]
MRKVVLLFFVTMSVTIASFAKGTVKMSCNESIYFVDGDNISERASVDRSLVSDFANYKKFYSSTTEPKVNSDLEVNYAGERLISDKPYELTWLVIDQQLYLCYIGGGLTPLSSDREHFQATAYTRFEECVDRKFNVDSPISRFNSKLMKADWVSGEYYFSQKKEDSGFYPWKKIVFENGKVIENEK